MAWELNVEPDDLRLVDASAGSGKTFTLMELVGALVKDEKKEDAGCILATTYTNKAAGELRQRIRKTLLESKRPDAAQQAAKASNGLIGTVNGVAGRILSDYALDAGMPPQLAVLSEEAADMIFKRAMAGIIEARSKDIGPVADRLGFSATARGRYAKSTDWQDPVQEICERARANGIDGGKLEESRQESVNAAERWFDGSVDLTLAGIKDGLEKYESELERDDVCGTTKTKYFAKAKDFLKSPTWEKAVALADDSQIAKTDETPLREFAVSLRKILIHATGMRDDVVKVINFVFEIAEEGLKAYQQFKERYGLIDFTDQEAGLLRLLQDEKFNAKLSERVHRVLVDEFQDTSPIQLALFSKLGEIAKGKMTWVGDPKQSIYGFRGADPALMAQAAASIAPNHRETLKDSWRSKEELVRFSNVLFENAFKGVSGCEGTVHLDIPEKRKNNGEAKGGKIEAWMLGASNVGNRAKQLVEGIVQLHEKSGVRYGDIAVLMRKGTDCSNLATALSERGVPVAVGGGKLFSTEEVQLALAAYRYAVDRKDTVALATLAAHLIDPEGWLKTISESPKETLEKWRVNCHLGEGIGDVAVMTPLELLNRAIVHFGIDRQARKMGEGARRIGNLEELRAKCAQYMDESALKGVPATHAGFIANVAADESKEASVPGGDSVKVVTYHAAKGLEWPTVILSTLQSDYKRTPFGLEVVAAKQFDPADPLKDRKLRWVPCPFVTLGSAFKQNVLCENADFKAEFKRIHDAEREECKRLMYVGVTRAKERLVFAPQMKTSKAGTQVDAGWLDELTSQSLFSGNWKFVTGDDTWTMGGEKFHAVATKVFTNVPDVVRPRYERSAGRIEAERDLPLYKLAPSSKDVAPCEATVGEVVATGVSLIVNGSKFSAELGDCFHNYMAVAVPGKDYTELANALVERWGQQGIVNPEGMVACGAALRDLIAKKWPGATVETEVPMSYENSDGQVSEGYIDMLVTTSEGKHIIIDHKVVADPDPLVHVKHYAGQQNIYRQAVLCGMGGEVSVYLHLPTQGRLVEMKFESLV
jgi:ATP-dependent exoDNAse (exonuclease V) beta subunit